MKASRTSAIALPRATALILVLIGPALAAQPPKAKVQDVRNLPQVWAMVVGVRQYEELLAFPRCHGAADDAARFARWLIDTAGWGPGHVLLLSDQDLAAMGFNNPAAQPEYRRATRANLDWGVRQWLPRRVRPGDVVVIYFAGQAVGLPPQAGEPPGRPPRDYLLPYDARANDLESTGWSLGDAIEPLALRGDYSIVCLLDTSPAGRVRSPGMLAAQPSPDAGQRMLKGISRWQGVTTWLAASGQPAGQADDGQGFLTQALIPALGLPTEAHNMTECLDRLRREPALARQGFLTAGGFAPRLSLWKSTALPPQRQDPPILQRGHGERVTALAFSADGSKMVSGSMDSTFRVWHAESGTLLRNWSLLDNGCLSVAQSGDGRLLVAGGGKGDVQFIDLERDVPKTVTEKAHRGQVLHVAVLPVSAPASKVAHNVLSVDAQGASVVWDASRSTVRRLSRPTDRGGRLPAVASRTGPVAFAILSELPGKASILAFDGLGTLVRELPVPKGRISATCISPDGKRLWAGTQTGDLAEYDLQTGEQRAPRNLGARITSLAATPLGLVVAFGPSIRLEAWERPGQGLLLDAGRPIGNLAASTDGRRIAVAGLNDGVLTAWEVDGELKVARVLELQPPKPESKTPPRALSLAFSPDGKRLVSGDQDGAIRSWELQGGKPRPTIAASRGRVRHLAISPDEKMLLQVSEDGIALIWEFDEHRGTRRVPGKFEAAGGFLSTGDLVLIDAEAEGEHNLVVHDRVSLMRRPIVFERPLAANGRARTGLLFSRLAISKDDRVAAGSGESPLACYWTPRGGKYILGPPIREHLGGITAVSFSGDGRSLLTAADDGLAKLWDLTGETPKLQTLFQVDNPSAPPWPVKAAAVSPIAGGPVAVGRQDRTVEIWQSGGKKPATVLTLSGPVRTVAFSCDGKLLAAGGDSRTITLRALDRPELPIPMSTPQNHSEMINSLVFWPRGPILASGSDDGTTRLWRLNPYRLMGTLSATDSGTDWVAFTPVGLFDASVEGERRVTWVPDPGIGVGDPLPPRLEQYRKWRHVFDLSNILARGEEPKAEGELGGPAILPRNTPPEIEIEPTSTPSPKQRQVDLKIRVGKDGLSDLRLYHNGVAVQGDLKLAGSTADTSVRLVNGTNQIYALGERPDSIDGRSRLLEFVYDGPTEGKTHVLALGISDYNTQKLRYAHKDAQAMAEYLQAYGLPQGPSRAGPPILLRDKEVSRTSVSNAFNELRNRVRGRPEDTVVIFMAGHTEVRQGLFCMLLPTAVLPKGPDIVAMRGVANQPPAAAAGPPPGKDPTLLPYGLIHLNLQFCDALNRLVIVDACQAAAVFDDPIVRRKVRQNIRQAADRDAHLSRTSYILATRRGEREQAVEAAPLEHGLLTYSLLRGMGKTDLQPLTPEPSIFRQYKTADLNHDGLVTTGELRQYAEMAVPILIAQFSDLVPRGVPARGAGEGEPTSSLYAQESDDSASFPLVKAPGP
jgi:WD40 repeat protein/uncharacterized caspase-like protein